MFVAQGIRVNYYPAVKYYVENYMFQVTSRFNQTFNTLF